MCQCLAFPLVFGSVGLTAFGVRKPTAQFLCLLRSVPSRLVTEHHRDNSADEMCFSKQGNCDSYDIDNRNEQMLLRINFY